MIRAILGFLVSIWLFIVHLFSDKHLVDEKRVWGVIHVLVGLLAPFVIPAAADPVIMGTLLVVGLALFLGVPLGDNVPILVNLKSLGILDLLTNKLNKPDLPRVLGTVSFVLAFLYLSSPLWIPNIVVNVQDFLNYEGIGVALLWAAIHGDHVAVHAEIGTKTQ